MIIFLAFFGLGLNYLVLKIFSLNLIFFFMRLQSLYFYGLKKKDIWNSISYLFFIPEMITGPHREYSTWKNPKINFNGLFQIEILIELLIYLNLLLGSGYFFNLFQNLSNFYFYKTLVVVYIVFVQFWSVSRIVNVISELFGQKIIRNFNNPFIATSFSDLWQRWHISLGNYVKKYITQPLNYLILKKGLSSLKSYYLSVLVSFLFIGIWHKVSLSYLLFALFSSLILLLERIFLNEFISRISHIKYYRLLLIVYTQFAFLLAVSPLTNNLRNIIVRP